jgi:hypothetical protein
MAADVNTQLRQRLQELVTADSEFDREIVDPRTVHCILLMILRRISANAGRELRIAHRHCLNRIPSEPAAELVCRRTFQQRHPPGAGQANHLFYGPRATILRNDYQAYFSPL